MQFPQIAGPTTPEQIFGSFVNKTGAASIIGRVVQFDVATARDGKAVMLPTTAGLSAVVGPMLEAGIPDGSPVLVGMYGLWNTLVKGKVAAGGATVAGNILVPVNGEGNLLFNKAGTGLDGFAVLCDTDLAQDAAAQIKKVLWRM